jgi:hypothetical protein
MVLLGLGLTVTDAQPASIARAYGINCVPIEISQSQTKVATIVAGRRIPYHSVIV